MPTENDADRAREAWAEMTREVREHKNPADPDIQLLAELYKQTGSPVPGNPVKQDTGD